MFTRVNCGPSAEGQPDVCVDEVDRWVEVQKLTPTEPQDNARFGSAVSLYQDEALISAYTEANGGAAYVFERSGGQWSETAVLVPSDGQPGDAFGFYAAAFGDWILVTARADDDLGTDSGSAYLFQKQGASWVQVTKLTASDGAAGDQFGYSCTLDGTTAVITALYDDDKGADSGSAYVFELQGGSWQQVSKLTANDGAPDAAASEAGAMAGHTIPSRR